MELGNITSFPGWLELSGTAVGSYFCDTMTVISEKQRYRISQIFILIIYSFIHRISSLRPGGSSWGLWSRRIWPLILHRRFDFFSMVLLIVQFLHKTVRQLCLASFEITEMSSLHSASDAMLCLQEILLILIFWNHSELNSVGFFEDYFYSVGICSAYNLPF